MKKEKLLNIALATLLIVIINSCCNTIPGMYKMPKNRKTAIGLNVNLVNIYYYLGSGTGKNKTLYLPGFFMDFRHELSDNIEIGLKAGTAGFVSSLTPYAVGHFIVDNKNRFSPAVELPMQFSTREGTCSYFYTYSATYSRAIFGNNAWEVAVRHIQDGNIVLKKNVTAKKGTLERYMQEKCPLDFSVGKITQLDGYLMINTLMRSPLTDFLEFGTELVPE